jgi:hypothetical protein
MSSSEGRRRAKYSTRSCAACQERKARFRYRGAARSDCDHTLCFECYPGEVNRARGRRLGDAAPSIRVPTLFGYQEVTGRVLDEHQVAHRRLMLLHLQHTPAERKVVSDEHYDEMPIKGRATLAASA